MRPFVQPRGAFATRLIAVAAIFAGVAYGDAAKAVTLPSPLVWLKADSGVGFDGGTGNVNAWTDSSGNNYNMAAGGSSEPVYVASGLNGKPVLRFDGTDDWMTNLSPPFAAQFPLTVYGVVKQNSGGLNLQAWLGSGDYRVAFGTNTASFSPNNSFLAWTPNGGNTYGSAGSLNTNWNLHTYVLPSTTNPPGWTSNTSSAVSSWSGYLNGVATGEVGLTGANPAAPYDSGGMAVGNDRIGDYWKGDIAEIIVYDKVLTQSERAHVTSYLGQKYDLNVPQWRTPTAVPFSSGGPFGGLATYAADQAIDGKLDTFSCLLDDSSYPTAPVTGRMVFDLGAPYQVTGAQLISRNETSLLNPQNVDFYLSNKDGDNLGAITSYGYSGLTSNASEDVFWTAVTTRYIGMQVNSSYEAGNYQIAEMLFNTALVPEPSTVVLLVAGLIGLLAYAWRKRR